MVWEDTRNGNDDLYGQRVDTNGLMSSTLALWTGNPNPQRYPDVAAAGAGGCLVVAEHQELPPAREIAPTPYKNLVGRDTDIAILCA